MIKKLSEDLLAHAEYLKAIHPDWQDMIRDITKSANILKHISNLEDEMR